MMILCMDVIVVSISVKYDLIVCVNLSTLTCRFSVKVLSSLAKR